MADIDLLVQEALAQQPKSQAEAAVTANLDNDPEAAAEAYQMSAATGAPPQLIADNVKSFKDGIKLQRAKQLLATKPEIGNFLARNPAAVPLVTDDLQALSNLHDQVQTDLSQGLPDSLLQGVRQGYEHQEYSSEAGDYQFGADNEDALKAEEERQKNEPQYGGFDRFMNGLGQLLGMTASSAKRALPVAAAGAAGGAAIGAAGAGVGAVPGAIAGAVGGFGYGFLADIVYTGSGSIYRQMDLARDRNGNPIPEPAKQAAALAGGLLMGAIAKIAPEQLTAPIRAAYTSIVGEAISRAAVEPTVGRALTQAALNVGKAGLTGGLLNTAFSAIQSITPEITKELTSQPFDTIFNNPEAREKLVGDLAQAFVDGAVLFGAIGIPTAGVHPIADMVRVRQAQADAQRVDATMRAADATQLKTRAPEVLERFIREANKGDVSIPAARVAEVEAERPGAFGYVEDLQQQLEAKLPEGGDVVIPASKYFARTEPDVHSLVKDDIRANAEGLTPKEAEELGEPPLVPAGHTRFYHGGVIPPDGGPRWVTEFFDYAKNYRENSSVYYVDIPNDHPLLNKAYDDTGTNTRAPYVNFEAPSEIAKNLKPVTAIPKSKPTVLGPAANEIKPPIGEPVARRTATIQALDRQSLFLNPLFESGQAAGMTEAAFRRYSQLIQEVQDGLNAQVYESARKDAARRETTNWKARANVLRTSVEEDFAGRRDLAADEALSKRTGAFRGLRFDRAEVGDLMNDPKFGDALDPRLFGRGQTVHPDEVAQLLGYQSGAAMLKDVQLLREDRARRNETPARQRARMISEETDRRMEDIYGRMDDRINAEALDAVLSTKQLDLLHEEVKALAGNSALAEGALTREEMVLANRERFNQMSIKSAVKLSKEFERLVGKHGRAAEMALLKGDVVAAFDAKQQQFNAALMLNEARAFEKEWNRADRLVTRYVKNDTVESVSQEFTDQIHLLLGSLGFPVPRNEAELMRGLRGTSLEQFHAQKTSEGRILVDPNIIPRDKKFDDFSVDEFRDFVAVLRSLDHVGREDKKISVAAERLEIKDVRRQINDELVLHGERFDPNDKGFNDRVRAGTRKIDSMLIKIERLFDWIDQRDPNGVLNRYVLRPLFEGQHKKDDMVREVGGLLKEAGKNILQSKMKQAVDNALLIDPYTNRPYAMTRENVIAMALNLGNRSNREKLLKGYGWSPEAVTDIVNRTLTKPEWDYVQSVWDIFKKYWPERDDIVRRTSGLGMDPIESERFRTPFGWMEGGYYPVVYDPIRAQMKEERPDPNALFKGNPNFVPLPARGSTISRTSADHPIHLELKSVLTNRINEMLHDIAFREPLLNAYKLLLQTDFRKQLSVFYGPEYADQIRPWLENIAGGAYIDDKGLSWLAREVRMNAQAMLIGFNPTTSFVHGVSAFFNSTAETLRTAGISAEPALLNGMFNPARFTQIKSFAMEHSGEVRNRMHNLDRDIGTLIDSHIGDWTLRAKFQYAAYWHIATLDQWSAIPTWMIAYDHYVKDRMLHDEAVYAADKILRNAHGSNGLVSQSAILRQNNSEWLKWFTMFSGYFNHNYNQERDIGRVSVDKSLSVPARMITTIAGSMMYLLAPALWHAYLRPGPGEANESWGAWTAKALGEQLAGNFPFVRDVAYGIKMHRDVSATPLGQYLTTFVHSEEDLRKAIEGSPVSKNWVSHSIATFGALGPALPGAAGAAAQLATFQVARGAQFLWDLHTGQQNATTFSEWYNGLVYGKSHPRR